MTQPYTDTDVELVAGVMSDWLAEAGVGEPFPEDELARVALSALAADGWRKLPAVGTSRVVRAALGSDAGPRWFQRTVTEWPDGTELVGPWLPVPEEDTDEHGNRTDTCGVCTLLPSSVSGWARMTQADCPEHGTGTWASPVTVTGFDTEEDTNR